jgi:hypothetical protein
MTDSTVFTSRIRAAPDWANKLAAASTVEAAETGTVVARWNLDFDLR